MKALAAALVILVVSALVAGGIGNAIHNDFLTVATFVALIVGLATLASKASGRRGTAQGED